MNLRHNIKKIINEIDFDDKTKAEYIKKSKVIKLLIKEVFGDVICGFHWDPMSFVGNVEVPYPDENFGSVRIILHITSENFRELGYNNYHNKKQELKDLILKFPMFNRVFVAFDTTKCDDKINESELTERCWKGYTQKGMKTMFGKRYPNCVKIKKKKSVRETIKNILDEEVTKKYPKPNEKVDKLVYDWLDNYFEGSQMYKKESWKYYSFYFEFCKNGREIGELNVRFDDKSPNFGPKDTRPTNERSVDEVWLYIYPVMIDELLTDIPIRKNYMMYLIEEWFEDTKLDEIQREFNRNDLSLDYVFVSESKKKGELCVPPIQKPENISMQEMQDLIKKNTLYSYKQMEENEEEEPGWTEELYMGILQKKERERINQEDRDNNPEPFNDEY